VVSRKYLNVYHLYREVFTAVKQLPDVNQYTFVKPLTYKLLFVVVFA